MDKIILLPLKYVFRSLVSFKLQIGGNFPYNMYTHYTVKICTNHYKKSLSCDEYVFSVKMYGLIGSLNKTLADNVSTGAKSDGTGITKHRVDYKKVAMTILK